MEAKMEAKKFYGVFKFCFQGRAKGYAKELASNLYRSFMSEDRENIYLQLKALIIDDSKEAIMNSAYGLRASDKRSRRHEYAIYSTYVHKFVVHECDEKGIWKPTKKELLNALRKVEEEMPVLLQNCKIMPEWAKFLRKQIDVPKQENALALEI